MLTLGCRSLACAFAVAALLCEGCHGEPQALDAPSTCASPCEPEWPDAATPDGGVEEPDAATVTWHPPELSLPDPDDVAATFRLSETGLYVDIRAKRLAPDVLEFEPAFKLWSDGAEKRRWLRLPEGQQVDVSDMEHWQFPVGTMAFKEFIRDGKRVETRLIARTGEGPEDYWMGAFAWDNDEQDAIFVPEGIENWRGTDHDVPRAKACFTCHRGEEGRILGFSAVQQPLAPAEWLTGKVPDYAPPGDAVTSSALGYLHANCGHCHNPNGTARPDTDMDLRLSTLDKHPQDTATYVSTVGVALEFFEQSMLLDRVVPGDPDVSGLLYRMLEREPDSRMPPLAVEIVDEDGVETVRAWIERM